jgi:diaminohydroxyphosphoribosylaminopyrimidine deaminase/5-amino-6-(5-phosphoribosylamino)uracil reductase
MSRSTKSYDRWMRRCLALARRAEGRTSPNPMVGAVVLDARGRVLAEGWHRRAGEPHGEADALAKLDFRARGATVVVNLEPCSHRGARRTQPCAPMLLEAGIARLVYGTRDPYPGHGGGAAMLAKAGVEVIGPVLEPECRRVNAPFLTWATRRRAHVTLKAAMSLDGRIATRTGESQWITGEAARHQTHRLRDQVDAILVGAGTVAADDPQLTTRGVARGRDPVRVVLDGRLSMSPRARMLRNGSAAPTWIATTRGAPAARARALEAAGAVVLRLPGQGGRVDLEALCAELGRRGVLSVLVEGGGETHAAFLEADLCDRLILHVAPLAIGGKRAPSWLGGEGVARLGAAPRFHPVGRPRLVGPDLLLEYERLIY